MARMLSFLLSLLSLLSLALAQETSPEPARAVFVYKGREQSFGPPSSDRTSTPSVTFALNADKSTGDLYFHLESPKENSWFGVGVGSSMANALFLIAYQSDNGTGVTISARSSSGHTEPSVDKNLEVEKLWDFPNSNTVTKRDNDNDDDVEEKIIVDAVCRKCAGDGGGSTAYVDFSRKEQPFIFAVGPPIPLYSDDLNAGLQEHVLYGSFTMDTTVATSVDSGAVPEGPYTMTAATLVKAASDRDPGSRIHGIVMAVTFVIILPLGALFVRIWNVRSHIVVQAIAFVLFLMAFAGGIVASKKYNKSRDFASAHQVLGILILIALLAQWVLGFLNHRTYKKTGQGTIMGKIHHYLGPITIAFGMINGALGFRFAGQRYLAIPYAIIILIIAVLFFALRIIILRRRNRKNGTGPYAPTNQGGAYYGRAGPYAQPAPGMPAYGGPPLAQQQQGYYAPSARDENEREPPPAYGAQNGGNGGLGIQLQQYPSSNSLPQGGAGAPVQPRPMV